MYSVMTSEPCKPDIHSKYLLKFNQPVTKLLKNSEGNRDDEWIFVEGRKQTLLYSCKRQE